MRPISVDHLVIATPDIDMGCTYVQRLLGKPPVPGGVHPDLGTRNALLGLSNGIYIEVVAPDPRQSSDLQLNRFLSELKKPDLMWWAARCSNLDALKIRLTRMHVNVVSDHVGSRRLPNGRELTWRLLQVDEPDLGAALPLFIEWHDMAVHPGRTLPVVGELSSFGIAHPAGGRLRSILSNAYDVCEEDDAQIRVKIDTGNRIISLKTPQDFPPGLASIV